MPALEIAPNEPPGEMADDSEGSAFVGLGWNPRVCLRTPEMILTELGMVGLD